MIDSFSKTCIWLSALCMLGGFGCSTTPTKLGGIWSRIKERQSYLAWNVRSTLGELPAHSAPTTIQLASLPRAELDRLLSDCPPPCREQLDGRWIGINRGFGAAIAGKTQYIKELHVDSQHGCGFGYGSNILVERVPFEDLNCQGWQPAIDPKTGCFQRQGRYAIVARGKTELDYSLAKNPVWEPSRFLVDELVQVDDGLILGRANFQWGFVRIPVAYFALGRVRCDTAE